MMVEEDVAREVCIAEPGCGVWKSPSERYCIFFQTDQNSYAIGEKIKVMRNEWKQISRMSIYGTHSSVKEKKVKYSGTVWKTTNISRWLTSKRRIFVAVIVNELCQIKLWLLLHLVGLLIRVLLAKSSPFDTLDRWNWASVTQRRSYTSLVSWFHCITCRISWINYRH